MPFTPYHFGPHLLVGMVFVHSLDVPTFILANVAVDVQPLLALSGVIDTPLHGVSHTLLGAAVIGGALGVLSIPLRPLYRAIFKKMKLPYHSTVLTMIVSGMLGAWFHVLTDMPIYSDINPFAPFFANPVQQTLSYHLVANLCLAAFVPAIMLLVYRMKNRKFDAGGQ